MRLSRETDLLHQLVNSRQHREIGETIELAQLPLSSVETQQIPMIADIQNINRSPAFTSQPNTVTYRNDSKHYTRVAVATVGVNRVLTTVDVPR